MITTNRTLHNLSGSVNTNSKIRKIQNRAMVTWNSNRISALNQVFNSLAGTGCFFKPCYIKVITTPSDGNVYYFPAAGRSIF